MNAPPRLDLVTPSRRCTRCAQIAAFPVSICSECGGSLFVPLTEPPTPFDRRSAGGIAGFIFLVQVSTAAFLLLFDFTTFSSTDFWVRDVSEAFVALVLHVLANVAGLGLSFVRAVPLGLKCANIAAATPCLYVTLCLVVWWLTDFRLPIPFTV